MTEPVKRATKSTQEQAVASWISYLNQIRFDLLVERLKNQDLNLKDALTELNELKQFIGNTSHILGSEYTKHGEIAEHMQVNIANARNAVQGLKKEYSFEGVGRTAPEDYLKNGQPIQSKFYNGLKATFFGHHGLGEHLKTYPDFVKNGGMYDIPSDQYQRLSELLDKYYNNPSSLSKHDFTLATRLDEFMKTNHLVMGRDITPSVVDYSEVQVQKAAATVNTEEKNILNKDKKIREQAIQDAAPTMQEGVKVTAVSAALEGGISFCLAVAQKRKEKPFSSFTKEDWEEIGISAGKGTVKGGIRGAAIYLFTNFTATPANIASAYVTAAFGIAAQIKLLESGEISKEDFVINCETICLDVSVSAISSLAGQIIIPIPVLGAIIGNVVGEFVYEICKQFGNSMTIKTVEKYYREMTDLLTKLDEKYQKTLEMISSEFERFKDIEALAFNPDVNTAFNASILLAEEVGVDSNLIIRNRQQRDDFFLG